MRDVPRTIAVDFDGVIRKYPLIPVDQLHKHDWENDLKDGPIDGAFEALEMLISDGYEVVIFTARTNHDNIREWAKRWPGGSVIEKIKITNVKPAAMAYIDDRALRFVNWPDTLKYFV